MLLRPPPSFRPLLRSILIKAGAGVAPVAENHRPSQVHGKTCSLVFHNIRRKQASTRAICPPSLAQVRLMRKMAELFLDKASVTGHDPTSASLAVYRRCFRAFLLITRAKRAGCGLETLAIYSGDLLAPSPAGHTNRCHYALRRRLPRVINTRRLCLSAVKACFKLIRAERDRISETISGPIASPAV